MKIALLSAFLVLSVHVFPQTNLYQLQIPRKLSNSIEDIQDRIKETGQDMGKHYPESYFEQVVKKQKFNPGKVIQVNDSIYHWKYYSGWVLNFRDIDMVYDANNNLISYLTQYRNGNTWENSTQYTATYDDHNNLTKELKQIWRSSTTLEDSRQFLYSYDANNNLTNKTEQVWTGSAWQNYQQYLANYDAEKNPIWEIWQGWNGYEWGDNGWQYTWTYDANNNKINGLRQYFNGSTWLNDSRFINTYDDNNNLTNGLYQGWFDTIWKDQGRSFYTCDSKNNLKSILNQWLSDTVWVNTSQTLYDYDSTNNLISELAQVWNGTDYYNSWQILFAYDTDNFMKGNSDKYWIYPENGSPVYVQGDSTSYYYHTVITWMPDILDSSDYVFPNPTNGKFAINSSSPVTAIEIYNLSGKRIYSDFNANQQTSKELDLTGYAKGIYIMKIYNGTKSYSRKIVIQ